MPDDNKQADEALLAKVAPAKTKTSVAAKPTEEFQQLLEEKAPVKPDRQIMKRFKAWFKDLSKFRKFALIFGVLVFIAGSIVVAWLMNLPKSQPATVVKKAVVKEEVKPVVIVSPLTGLPTTEELSKRPVTGVMIENSPDARPQSGLTEAGVVYEAIAEGGITRFLALYQEAQPTYIGPVRSARPYYLQWLSAYDASLAHAGGSADALKLIKRWKIEDLDHRYYGSYYRRVSNRQAPHNLYTSMANLDKIKKLKGITGSTFTGFLRKADEPSKAPTATSVDFTLSGYLYNAHFDYDAATNTYLRSEGNRAHKDEKSGKQIAPKVVIANVMTVKFAYNGVNTDYTVTGSGKCYIFQDGVVTIGKWQKNTRTSALTFIDANGKVIPINAGQTWITAVGSSSGVKYKPPKAPAAH